MLGMNTQAIGFVFGESPSVVTKTLCDRAIVVAARVRLLWAELGVDWLVQRTNVVHCCAEALFLCVV